MWSEKPKYLRKRFANFCLRALVLNFFPVEPQSRKAKITNEDTCYIAVAFFVFKGGAWYVYHNCFENLIWSLLWNDVLCHLALTV